MRKVLTIAVREYRAMVGTKAFVLSIIMMPILMLGSLFAMKLMQNVGEIKLRKIAVIDMTGQLFDVIKTSADAKNEAISMAMEEQGDDSSMDDNMLGFSSEKYLFEKIDVDSMTDDLRIQLSNRIKEQDLYAFVEIGPDSMSIGSGDTIRYFSQDSSLSTARGWLAQIINEHVRTMRLQDAKIDPEIVRRASTPIAIKGMGLVSKTTDGGVREAEETDTMQALFLPMGVMMLMFMVIFMASQPMLESVLEEKSQRIAEVLLGSANPFQLMFGKLLGTVGGSLTVFIIYLAGAYGLAANRGWTDSIPFQLTPWFLIFQVVGVFFYASIFMAVGASVSQLKEAQSMLLPVWMLLMSPLFIWIFIVREPLGTMATAFSLFPPATSTTMMLRLATGQNIPFWQPVLGLVLTIIATLFIVFLASRIFRVGILWQGKTPKLTEIIRWAFTG